MCWNWLLMGRWSVTLAVPSPDSRFSVFLDSQVAKSAAAKSRSTSLALLPGLGRISAHQLAFGLYPSLGYSPTRLNPADDPTRFVEVRPPCQMSLIDLYPLECLHGLGELRMSRLVASWSRLFLLRMAIPGPPSQLLQDALAGRFAPPAAYG